MKRLVLFDIDGTLVRGGPAKGAFELAMEIVFGTAGQIGAYDFSGKTDPQIARELLQEAGKTDPEIDAGLEDLWEEYLGELARRLPGHPMTVLPGVRGLLDHLKDREDIALGLLTGNIIRGARLKLNSVDLMGYFPVGGYGSDGEEREALPPVAMQRAAATWGNTFPASSVVVVGDTPRDVECGKYSGTQTVAVATGRFDVATLEATGADRVLDDFRELARSVDALLG
ncbi:MAG: HAD family hydrolase [Planctomycetota bacterium]|jgi:phosphoglycolate phosphatase-like HAD superfamily hydrolase